MSNLSKQLKSFEMRVRVVRSWRGLAIGACVGAAISSVWAVLDWRSILYTEWSWMVEMVGSLALAGAVIGLLLNPMLASAAMALSSVSVIANSLRLRHAIVR